MTRLPKRARAIVNQHPKNGVSMGTTNSWIVRVTGKTLNLLRSMTLGIRRGLPLLRRLTRADRARVKRWRTDVELPGLAVLMIDAKSSLGLAAQLREAGYISFRESMTGDERLRFNPRRGCRII